MITITPKALDHIQENYKKESIAQDKGLRLGVTGGGCSGLSYKVEFSDPRPNDNILDFGGMKVFVDPKSSIYLKDLVLDYKDGLNGKGLVFENPNAKNTCGCGESFSV